MAVFRDPTLRSPTRRTGTPRPQQRQTSRFTRIPNQFDIDTGVGVAGIAAGFSGGGGGAGNAQSLRDQLALGLENIGFRREELGLDRDIIEFNRKSLGENRIQLGLGVDELGIRRNELGINRQDLSISRNLLGIDRRGLGLERETAAFNRSEALRGVINNALRRGLFGSGIQKAGEERAEARADIVTRELGLKEEIFDEEGKRIGLREELLDKTGKRLDLDQKTFDSRGRKLDIESGKIEVSEERTGITKKRIDLSEKELRLRIDTALSNIRSGAASNRAAQNAETESFLKFRAGLNQDRIAADQAANPVRFTSGVTRFQPPTQPFGGGPI